MKRLVFHFQIRLIKNMFQEEAEVGMSAKELEEAKKAEKELQARNVSFE